MISEHIKEHAILGVQAANGTVTTVSVTTANGVSGTVATATTTPAITLSLGAITPSTVNGVTVSGSSTPTLAVTGTSSISGSNTGDNAANSSSTYIGTTAVALNRASAALSLSGVNVDGSSGTCTGNAGSATKLATARAINGVDFDGTAPITLFNKAPCTVVVASSTSKNKEQADYICDGTADDVQIQAATDYIAGLTSTYPTSIGTNGKGKIVLLEGVYNIDAPIKIKPGINYEGQGASTVIKAKTNFNDNLFEFDEPTVNPSAGTIFRFMWFDGNKTNNTSGTAIDTKVGTIALWDLVIEDCYFFDFDGPVLAVDDPWGFRLYNSIIEDCTAEAVVIAAGASKITGASIENCKIIQTNIGGSTHCISITNCEGIKLIGNELNTSGSGATVLLSGGGGHIIQGNRFGASTNCLADIAIANSSNFNVVTGNWVIGSKAGVAIEAASTDNLITSNTFNSITNAEISDSGTNTIITGNRGDDAVTNRDFFRNNSMNVLNGICEFRLTLTSATPVTTADVTAAGTIYMTPYKGNRISLFDGTNWKLMSTAEVNLALTATSGKNYDVWAYDNSGTVTLETTEWTNDTTRATALALQDGVLCKTGALTRRYIGTFRASDTNKTEDSILKRYVWNYYNRVSRNMFCTDTTDSWTYTTATWRQANGAAANKVEFVLGYSEDIVTAESFSLPTNSGNIAAYTGIGLDATNTNSALLYGGNVAAIPLQCWSKYDGYIGIGYHYLAWLEISTASGTTTWYGDAGATAKCGLTARILS